MIVKSIKLTNFRSHKEYLLKCNKNTSLILGENGSGKTSVLEAIYICTRGKSFRATDTDILKRGEEFYRIELEYKSGERVVASFDGSKKTFLVSDKKTARLPKKNRYPVVLFLPDDLHLIDSSPTRKRDYFDRVIGSLSDSYSDLISKYEKALKQRNEALKTIFDNNINDDTLLFSWNILLAKYGTKIRNERIKFIKELNSHLTKIYQSIAKNKDEVAIEYVLQDNKIQNENEYLSRLLGDFKKDLYIGHTSYGVHRDNYEFIFNNQSADGSASRGEVRSVILAMKFIEAAMIFEKTHKKPLVLLDDVFSELDKNRQAALVKNFKENQVIITSVDGID